MLFVAAKLCVNGGVQLGITFKVERCITLVEMILPMTAPATPTKAPLPNPRPVIKATTTKPMPKAVPKLVSETSWYFLK